MCSFSSRSVTKEKTYLQGPKQKATKNLHLTTTFYFPNFSVQVFCEKHLCLISSALSHCVSVWKVLLWWLGLCQPHLGKQLSWRRWHPSFSSRKRKRNPTMLKIKSLRVLHEIMYFCSICPDYWLCNSPAGLPPLQEAHAPSIMISSGSVNILPLHQ